MFDKTFDLFGFQVSLATYVFFFLIFAVVLSFIFKKPNDHLSPEEKTVSGLPIYTEPGFVRLPFTIALLMSGTIMIPMMIQAGLAIPFAIVLYAFLFYACYLLLEGFGKKEEHRQWLADDKIERQKNVALLQRERDELAEKQRAAQLDEDNARYATTRECTFSPDEITEAARRVADELKNG